MDWKSRGNYSEIVDCVISRMQLEHLKKRVEEIFAEADKELIFRSMKHRNDFYSLLMGKRAKALQHTPNYAAAVFLLFADEDGCVVVHSADGKNRKLEPNRRYGNDIICSPFFICAEGEEGEFISLTDEQIEKYSKQFAEIEQFSGQEPEIAGRMMLLSL